MFNYTQAKNQLKNEIEKYELWRPLSKIQGCHIRTLKKWFSPDFHEIPFSFIALCRETPELRLVMLSISRSWINTLKYDQTGHELNLQPTWFICQRYQFNSQDSQSAAKTMGLLQEFYTAMMALPNHRFWLKESGDDQVAIIDIRCPYRPIPISPIESDTYGWRYMAPSDEIEPCSNMNYNQLIQLIFASQCGREMWQWADEMQTCSTLLLPTRTVRHAYQPDSQVEPRADK
jgi:hypothetical protein